MISIHFPARHLMNLRFAFSPLLETSVSYHLLRHPEHNVLYSTWVDDTRRALHGIELPYMDAVILARHYTADFLTPPPPSPRTNFEEEMATVLATPHEIVRQNVQYIIDLEGSSEVRDFFLAYPGDALYCLVEELRLYWKRAVAPYWPRIQAVLENDVLYRARTLATEGIESVIKTLHPIADYQPGVVTLDKHYKNKDLTEYFTDSSTLALVPSVFSFSHIYWQLDPAWQPMLMYPTRGTGLWYSSPPDTSDALEVTLGEGRAKVFLALRDPASTGELAGKLHFTSGAVSQHLALLRRAGLIESFRSGHHVFHRLSERGEKMLALFT